MGLTTYKNKYEMKSIVELYFSYYLDELQEAGFIKDWEYETFTFQLAEPVKYFYLKKKYSKVFLSFLKMLAQ